jgi:hypothetical protein
MGHTKASEKVTKPKRKISFKLYWCETEDHDEDWFIVAKSKREACRCHEGMEGYWVGDAWATYVCTVPEDIAQSMNVSTGWPKHELIEACGGEFIKDGEMKTVMHEMMGVGCRTVKFNDKVYTEGDLVANVQHELSKKKKSRLN